MTVRELGYKPYTGERLGRLRRILAIAGVGSCRARAASAAAGVGVRCQVATDLNLVTYLDFSCLAADEVII